MEKGYFTTLEFCIDNLGTTLEKQILEIVSERFFNLSYKKNYQATNTVQTIEIHLFVVLYFIVVYKNTYTYSLEKRNKNEQHETLEQLKKGYKRKKEKFLQFKEESKNTDLNNNYRARSLAKRMLILLAQNKRYSKTGLLIPAIMHMNKDFLLNLIIKQENNLKTDIDLVGAFENTLDYFSFTYIATSKIVTSFIIVMYTRLTMLGIESKEALDFTKYVANRLFGNDVANDYREDFFTDRKIYLAGIYNGIPIFNWYVPKDKNNPNYYSDKDIESIRSIFNKYLIPDGKIERFFIQSIALSILPKERRKAVIQETNSDFIEYIFNDNKNFEAFLYTLHRVYANAPGDLSQFFQRKLPWWRRAISSIFWKFFLKLPN